MMTAVSRRTVWISPEEYLAGELTSATKRKYVEGQVYAMAGASADHNIIAGNIYAELRAQLRGGPCTAFISDMKVRIPPAFASADYYLDVVVSCSERERDPYVREEPAVIFEVLLPGTERTDRLEKAAAYLHLPSLQAYVVVAQDRASVIVRSRNGVSWDMLEWNGMADVVQLPGIRCELTLDQIYERVSWRSTAQPGSEVSVHSAP